MIANSLPTVDHCTACQSRSTFISTGLKSLFPKTDMDVVAHVRERVASGTKLFVGFSGGKDSTATCLLLLELGLPFEAVFQDTGWESEVTYTYVRWCCLTWGVKLHVIRSDRYAGFRELVIKRGCFPKRKRRHCTEELKEKPMEAFIAAQECDCITIAGIRAEESAQRASMQTWTKDDDRFGCDTWHPVFTWTYEDVIAMHHRAGHKPNPLYLLGVDRVGCFPCVMAGKAETRLVSIIQPERISEIREMEYEVDQRVRDRMGDRYDERSYPTSTMFWLSIRGQSRPAAIDDVVERAWTPANAKERETIGEYRSLAAQSERAQRRWGYTLDIDLSVEHRHDDDAFFANYCDNYLSRAELAAQGA